MSPHVRRAASRLALAAVALLAACDDAPTTPLGAPGGASAPLPAVAAQGAARSVSEQLIDFDESLTEYPCGDGYTEAIRMHGKLFVRFAVTADGAGGFHAVGHSMPVGLGGVGVTSGAAYRVTEREHLVFNQSPMATTSTWRLVLDAHAPDIDVRARLVVAGHWVMNANGDLVVERPTVRAECRR